jgi:hypothetical protein
MVMVIILYTNTNKYRTFKIPRGPPLPLELELKGLVQSTNTVLEHYISGLD